MAHVVDWPRAGEESRGPRAEPTTGPRGSIPRWRVRREGLAIFGLPSALFVGLILLLPLVALGYRTFQAGVVPASLRSPLVVQSLQLSAWTSTITVLLAIAFGLPLAYVLARWRFPGRRIVDTLVDLPLVLPPVVAGVGLLMAFGRRGLLGERLEAGFTVPLVGWHVGGLSISFSTTAVILAQVFVATPFFIRAARAGFARVEHDIEEAAALDGASPWQTFRLITVPLALPALSSGLVLCWARAVGEFGATMMFAGNLPGRTQTMPLAIMSAMEGDIYAALALSVLLVVVSFALLFLYRLIGNRRGIEV